MEEQKYKGLKLGERGAIISLVAYILSIYKLVAGYLSDSAALKADGLNNTTDIIASAVLIGLRIKGCSKATGCQSYIRSLEK